MNTPFGTGADKSLNDIRTVSYEPTLAALYTEGGVDYLPEDIENQHKVGICTAISLVQEREKVNGKKYSPDFQYLLQKKFYDLNWTEGSSILVALKVGRKYGFLPADKWTYTTEADRELPYAQYVAKLQAIPQAEINRLLALCVDKILGYAQIDVNNPVAIARAISESKAGIICRFSLGVEWWTPQIDPLRAPKAPISGHAIVMNRYSYLTDIWQVLSNTWGSLWNIHGTGNVNYTAYRPTEAWAIVEKVYLLKDLYLGLTDPDVKLLQKFLNVHGYPLAAAGAGSPGNETEYFGDLTKKATIRYQIANNIQPSVGYVGIITRSKINSTNYR